MMQYAQWQSQPSCTFTKPRVREVARERSERAPPSRSRARTSCSVSAHASGEPPSVSPIVSATSSAVPTKARTRASIAANRSGARFTAQPATWTRWAWRSDRRTDWRDLDSASAVIQQVLITCSSASSSATSVWPAASSAPRAAMASAWETLQPRNLTANPVTARDGNGPARPAKHRGASLATGPRDGQSGSAPLATHDRPPVVLGCDVGPPRCPRARPRGEERGLPQICGTRLGPWHDDVEEQATDGHADREWVGHWFTSSGSLMVSDQRRFSGCASRGATGWAVWTRFGGTCLSSRGRPGRSGFGDERESRPVP